MKLLIIIILGYLIGSVPFALVIGKLFYKTDIREYGSGNLGGSNAGRVLGKRAGLGTMALDLLKVTLVMLIAKVLDGSTLSMALAALAAGIGHCYPVFAGFKGGKAVASMYGYLFGLVVLAGCRPFYFFLPLVVYAIVLVLGRMSSLASITSTIVVTVYICLQSVHPAVKIVQFIYCVLIVARHRANIGRIINHNENKITWLPK